MITSTQISKTKYFKVLDNVQKKMVVKKESVERINLGVTMSGLKSFDFWVGKTSPTMRIESVVRELVNGKKK